MKIVVAFMVLLSVAAASAQVQGQGQVYEKLVKQEISQMPTAKKAPVPPKKKR